METTSRHPIQTRLVLLAVVNKQVKGEMMRRVLFVATIVALGIPPSAMAGCKSRGYGVSNCNDGQGNSYVSTQIGNTTAYEGQNSDGSQWTQVRSPSGVTNTQIWQGPNTYQQQYQQSGSQPNSSDGAYQRQYNGATSPNNTMGIYQQRR